MHKEKAFSMWVSKNAKVCRICNQVIEKSSGSNYLVCICGNSFCYLCNRPWFPYHHERDEFQCHLYRKNEDSIVARKKDTIGVMNFYTQKYLNEDQNEN